MDTGLPGGQRSEVRGQETLDCHGLKAEAARLSLASCVYKYISHITKLGGTDRRDRQRWTNNTAPSGRKCEVTRTDGHWFWTVLTVVSHWNFKELLCFNSSSGEPLMFYTLVLNCCVCFVWLTLWHCAVVYFYYYYYCHFNFIHFVLKHSRIFYWDPNRHGGNYVVVKLTKTFCCCHFKSAAVVVVRGCDVTSFYWFHPSQA